jgi:hypothetical protein
MKTVTVDQFLELSPCYKESRIREIARDKVEWSALDVLALEDISAEDRLWAVLREEFIDAPVLHEFACRCAEVALATISDPDPRYVEAIATKRRWLRGEATDEELKAAGAAAAWYAARYAARYAAQDAAWYAAWAAWAAARAAAWEDVARRNQIALLRGLLEENDNYEDRPD